MHGQRIRVHLALSNIPQPKSLVLAVDASVSTDDIRSGGLGYIVNNGLYGICGRYQYDHQVRKEGIAITELEAVLFGLAGIQEAGLDDQRVHILSDSQEVVKIILSWQKGTIIYPPGYINESNRPDGSMLSRLAHRFSSEPKRYQIQWTKGHRGHRLNEAAHYLAGYGRMVFERRMKRQEALALGQQEAKKALKTKKPHKPSPRWR